MEFCSVNMDAWYYRFSVACDIMEQHGGDVRTIWIHSHVTYASVVHTTRPFRAMWRTHALTFNRWHKKKKKNTKNKKVTIHMLTHGTMRGCALTSLVACINDKFCDIREGNVTIRSEMWTTSIRSLGFWDIRECVTLWRLILRSWGCISPLDTYWDHM
jgi:hypothetical protein